MRLAIFVVIAKLCACFAQVTDSQAEEVKHVADTDSLVYAQVLFRHGDRTPAIIFPNTNEEAAKWPEGLGELTKIGMAQQYRLGQWLRKRYYAWLGSRFDRAEIYVRSSDFNRTLMSATVNMAGMFPPTKEEHWTTGFDWQPVPVHSKPKIIDKELNEEADCPKASEELAKVWKGVEAQKLNEENRQLLSFLGLKTGYNPMDVSKMFSVFDMLVCQSAHQSTNPWPEWVNDTLFERIQVLYEKSCQFEYSTDLLRRLRGGSLVSEMLERFEAKQAGQLGQRAKIYIYSAHDATIAATLATLGFHPEIFPLYATALILELHRKNGQNILQVYHKNITDSPQVFRLNIPDCPGDCTLEQFRSAMTPFLPVDWHSECGLHQTNDVTLYILAIVVLGMSTLVLGSVVILDVAARRRRPRRDLRRHVDLSDAPLMADDDDLHDQL